MGRILEVWFPLLVVFSKMEVLVLAQAQDPTPTVKAGYINIDCGAPNDYDDTTLSLHYYTDAGFVDSGENRQISTQFIESQIWQQTKNLRVFYTGTRNCYTLRTDRGKGKKYFIRAMFFYGNYDGKNQNPKFDLYIGTDYWSTVDTTSNDYDYEEIIHSPRTDDIQVCLVNTGNGFPFISNLELRLLDDSSYQVDSAASLNKMWRYDIGGSRSYYRYPQDAYDRLWYAKSYDWITLNSTGTPGLTNNSDAYKVPEEVMQTVQRAADANSSIKLEWRTITNRKWQIYFHFAELEYLPRDQKRQFNVYVNGELTETVTLEYLKPVSVASGLVYGSQFDFSINATNKSGQYPPILNAVEFYTIVSHFTTPTAEDDITAMYDIKKFYGIKRESWQGDPCAPKAFIWDGLQCSYDNPPRIITLYLCHIDGPLLIGTCAIAD